MKCRNCFSEINGAHVTCSVCSKELHEECAVKKEGEFLCDLCNMEKRATGKKDKSIVIPEVIRRSHIETYRTCPFKFMHEVINNVVQPPNIYTQLGIDLHDMFDKEGRENFYGSPEVMKEEYMKLFEEYPDYFFERVSRNDMKKRAETSIETFYNIIANMEEQFASEVTIQFSVGDNLPKVQMTFDRINQNENGNLEVFDWKTGSVMVGQKLSSDIQAPLYIKGIQDHYNKQVDSFTFLYVNENKERVFNRIDDLNYVCRVGKKEYFININEAIKEIQRVFSKIQKGSFNIPSGKNMNYICKYCHIKEKNLCEGADVQSWRNSYTENFDWKRGK